MVAPANPVLNTLTTVWVRVPLQNIHTRRWKPAFIHGHLVNRGRVRCLRANQADNN